MNDAQQLCWALDKNRYIATLEKRLLQARRSSHSRVSTNFSKTGQEENEWIKKLEEKDATIADLQKTVSVLRSALLKREVAELTPEASSVELRNKKKVLRHQRTASNGSSQDSQGSRQTSTGSAAQMSPITPVSPMVQLSPRKVVEQRRKSVDEMSKMLDEMIQDHIENGQLVKAKRGSTRVPLRSVSNSDRTRSRRNSSHTTMIGRPPSEPIIASSKNREFSTLAVKEMVS